jgi:hypothetical protein
MTTRGRTIEAEINSSRIETTDTAMEEFGRVKHNLRAYSSDTLDDLARQAFADAEAGVGSINATKTELYARAAALAGFASLAFLREQHQQSEGQ